MDRDEDRGIKWVLDFRWGARGEPAVYFFAGSLRLLSSSSRTMNTLGTTAAAYILVTGHRHGRPQA